MDGYSAGRKPKNDFMAHTFPKGHKFSNGGKREGAGRKPDLVKKEIKELAGEYREEAILRLAYWMRTDNSKASIAASIAILDRSDGKPPQALTHSGTIDIEAEAAKAEIAESVKSYLGELLAAKH